MTQKIEFNFNSMRAGMTAALLLVTMAGCSQQEQKASVKKIPANAQYSGFFKSYDNLKPVSGLDGTAMAYINTDAQKNLHQYIACVVDPVEVYLASNADDAKFSETGRSAATEYFRAALVKAVSDACPVVDKPGPLVLRLRSALVGVDFGGQVTPADQGADKEKALTYTVNIGKVQVEMELLDSETGDQIAALVDKETLGQGAEIGSPNLAREEKWTEARQAFDGWANRVRDFLNTSVELSAEDADKADKSYQPYDSVAVAAK